MPIHDLRRLDDNIVLAADVCIVGSGPAAWTLSEELRDSGLSILVLESGPALESETDPSDSDAEAMNATIDTGAPLFNGRRRRLGGTTEVAGWANRTIAFDPIDYEARPWVPHSGWPIEAATMAPFLARASMHLGVGAVPARAPLLPGRGRWPPIDPQELAPVTWTFGQSDDGKPVRYALNFRRRHHPALRILVHATVTQLVTNASGTQIEAVAIASPDGKRATARARAVVLATGGIENPRLLLCSNRLLPCGLGNAHGLVGRFLMDHPRDLQMAVTFDPKEADRLRAMFGPFRIDLGAGSRSVSNGVALSEAHQRRDALLNSAAWYIEDWAEDDPVAAVKRMIRREGHPRTDLGIVLRNAAPLMRATYRRVARNHVLHRKPSRIGLVIGSEQQPDPESRITLSGTADRFGLPLAKTHWRINQAERASQIALAQSVAREFGRVGLPQAVLADWAQQGAVAQALLVDGCHPTGTTRMADSSNAGVVDSNCQVHGVAGLYVAGSSIFPTAGHANPTLMIAAMAARLADHLIARLAPGDLPAKIVPVAESKANGDDRLHQIVDPIWRDAAVVVTGASGFLGNRLVECLVSQGARVVCLLRDRSRAASFGASVETRALSLDDLDAVRSATAGADYVFHCAYDWSDQALNRRAMATLIEAGKANRWKRFVQVSSFVVYDVPPSGELTEDVIETTALSGYARTKVELEAMLIAAVTAGTLSATIIQPSLIYGPRSQPWTMDPVDKLINGTVVLPDHGDGVCNAVFVDDVIRAMMLAAQSPRAHGERLLISGPPTRWREFYGTLAKAAGVAGPVYMSHDAIVAKNRGLVRVARGLLTPRLLARKIAQLRPVHRAIGKVSPAMPDGLRRRIEHQLYGPISRLRGHRHLPDKGELTFLKSSATIRSHKAERLIGYMPHFDLAAGMAATASYIQAYRREGDGRGHQRAR